MVGWKANESAQEQMGSTTTNPHSEGKLCLIATPVLDWEGGSDDLIVACGA